MTRPIMEKMAVMRRAVADYLRRTRRRQIADAYRKAYGDGQGLGDEFAGWDSESVWPED